MISKEPLDFVHRKYLVSRVYVTFSIAFTVLTGIFEPASLYFQIMHATAMDKMYLWVIFAVSMIALADITINDLMPDKYKLLSVYHNRHIIYMGLALSMFSISAAITYTYGSSFHLARLWLDGTIAALVAILDIFARHKGTSW